MKCADTMAQMLSVKVQHVQGMGKLVVRGSTLFVFSKEEVTQGDPLSTGMFLYSIGSLLLISSLNQSSGSLGLNSKVPHLNTFPNHQ